MHLILAKRQLLNIALALSLISLFILSTSSNATVPDTTVTNFPSVQGIGQTTFAAPDGSVYIGGKIGGVGGTSTAGDVLIDSTSPTSAHIDIPKIDRVYARVPDGNGGWYIGGEFTSIESVQVNNLAHISSTQTVDTNFNADINDDVNSLYFDEASNVLYVGGNFTSINNNTTPIIRNHFAAVNGTTGVANNFNPDINDSVQDMALDTDTNIIYAVGAFSNVNMSTTNTFLQGVAAFNTSDGTATSFNPGVFGTSRFVKLNTTTDTLYIGGVFDSVNQNSSPVNRSNIAAFDISTGTAKNFDPSIADNSQYTVIRSLELDESTNTLYVGGWFNTVNSNSTPKTRRNVAAFNGTTAIATSFDPDIFVPNPENAIDTLALNASTHTLYVAGEFNRVNNNTSPVARRNTAAFDTTTSFATDYNPNVSGDIDAITLDPGTGQIWNTGKVYGTGGTSRNNVVHIFSDGTLDPIFNPDIDGMVSSFAIDESSNTIYIGGYFTTANITTNPTNRDHLAAFDLTTGAIKSFNAGIILQGYGVKALAYDNANNVLYATGNFSSVNVNTTPVQRLGLAAFDGTTGEVLPFNPAPGSAVSDIALDATNHILYAAGYFTSVNSASVPRNRIAAFDTNTTGAATSFNPNVNGYVTSIDLNQDGSVLFAAGEFTSVNTGATPVARNNAAAFSTSTSIATSFDPNLDSTGSAIEFNSTDSTVFISGLFANINNGASPITQFGLASFDSSSGIATSFRPTITGMAFSFSLDEQANRLYASGLFVDPAAQGFVGMYTGALAVFGVSFAPSEPNEETTTTAATTVTTSVTSTTIPSNSSTTTTPNSVQDTQVSTTKVAGNISGINKPLVGSLPTTGSNSMYGLKFSLALLALGLSTFLLKTSKLLKKESQNSTDRIL